jgi:hypothetical protein
MQIDGKRPAPVRDASILLMASAALAVAAVAAGAVAWQHLHAATPAYLEAVRAAGETGDDLARQISLGLSYDIVVALGLALTTGVLCLMVRQPVRWAQVATWVTAFAVWFALGCGLAAAPGVPGLPTDTEPTELDLRAHDLLVSWYPSAQSILVYGLLAAMTAAAVLLLRAPAQEFYRPQGVAVDPGWSSFIRERD